MMILLVWQPVGWISYKVQCKLQKKKSNTKMKMIIIDKWDLLVAN